MAGRRGFLARIHQRIRLSRDHVVINTTALTSTVSFIFILCFNFTFKWNRNTLTSKLRIRNKYSIENKALDTTFLEMFQKTDKRHTRCTRQASRNDFVPPKTKLSTTKRTIMYTGAITWNRIPSEIKNSKSKATFCKAFSEHLREKY